MAVTSNPTEHLSFGAPLSPEARRQRLLRIRDSTASLSQTTSGVVQSIDEEDEHTPEVSQPSTMTENSSLQTSDIGRSYGTLPLRRRTKKAPSFATRRGLPQLPILNILQRSASNPVTPVYTHSTLRDLAYSRLSSTRPISAYDPPLHQKGDEEGDADAKINGIRVWYSSFTSIDWLHDAIKDSVRFSKLRRRHSIRSRLLLAFDKSLGWIIVTIVGFLTAIVAFLVVRSEQFLFDLKEGHCRDSWWRSKKFCCPVVRPGHVLSNSKEDCAAWETWAEVLSPGEGIRAELVEYISYTWIALLLALISCLLTIYLTDSTTFTTRKESGVAVPPISNSVEALKGPLKSNNEPKRKVMYYAAGSGIPEIKTILSGFVIHGYLGVRVLFTKSVGLALSVASGLSLGKEGPFVHIASCIGNIVSRFASKYETNEAKRREILSAACAAGVAVAFGAPIGGTLFSLEEVSYFFPPKVMWRSFFCAMIAAITLKILDPFRTGKLVLFQVTYDKDWHAYELVPFLFLGLFGGIYGAYFSKLNYRWSKDIRGKTWIGAHPIIEVLMITLLTSVLCFLNPYTRMGGTELVYKLFSECRTGSRDTHSDLCVINPGSFTHAWPVVKAILVAMVVKSALTVVTFGIKVPAGIFIPTLGVGACAGRVLGITMQWLQVRNPDARLFGACNGDLDCVIPGLYAMVGAAAALSGVTRTTVSLAVIMFELTDTLTYAVPVMLSVLVAKTVADALEPKGIYDLVIELSKLPYLDYKHEYIWGNLQISEVVSRDVPTIRLDQPNTVQSLGEKLLNLVSSGAHDSGFPILRKDVTDGSMRMVGYIGANELEHALSVVADDEVAEVYFHPVYTRDLTSSVSSFTEPIVPYSASADPLDFTPYMDQAPLTLSNNSPLEILHQFFTKLGAKYVVVTDTDGLYEGVIEKKTWLAFLSGLEEKS